MVNTQDPLLNFPASVSFTPYAFFRNVSATPRTLHSVVYYMDGRTVKSLPLADLTLQPGGASALPIGNLMRSQTQIEGINLSFSYDGTWGDILAGVGSVDQTGNYVFPVAPERVYKGGARGSAYWLAAGGFDTMYTLWNPTPDAQDFLVTLRYGTNGDSYKLPVTLEPYASTMIDIGELIRTQQLDQAGRILPAAVTQGSLLVSSPANDPKDAIEVVLSGGIYNPTKATCSLPCQTCQGLTSIECNPTSVTVPVGGQDPVTFGYTYSNGNYYSLASSATWTSSAPNVLTVGGGVVTGVSPGGATWLGSDPNPIAVYTLQFCSDSMCPVVSPGNCGGNGAVVQLACNGSSSSITVTRGDNVSCTVSGAQASQVTGWEFQGEGVGINGPTGVTSWSGTMVVGGDITVTAAGQALSLTVAVNPRTSFPQVTMPSPQLVANGSAVGNQQLPTLTSPPTTDEGSMGDAAYGYGYTVNSPSIQAGPNQTLHFVVSLSDNSAYGWELNPGLTNSSDAFYQHQGNCYSTVAQIVAAVQAHEVGTPGPSHYSEVQAALAANNPGTVAESLVGSQSDIDAPIRAAYDSAVSAGRAEPPNNLSTLRINFPPYQSCP